MEYKSIEELCRLARESGRRISDVVLSDQAAQLEKSRDELFTRMSSRLEVMEQAIAAGLNPALRSTSGLTGGDAAKLWERAGKGGLHRRHIPPFDGQGHGCERKQRRHGPRRRGAYRGLLRYTCPARSSRCWPKGSARASRPSCPSLRPGPSVWS